MIRDVCPQGEWLRAACEWGGRVWGCSQQGGWSPEGGGASGTAAGPAEAGSTWDNSGGQPTKRTQRSEDHRTNHTQWWAFAVWINKWSQKNRSHSLISALNSVKDPFVHVCFNYCSEKHMNYEGVNPSWFPTRLCNLNCINYLWQDLDSASLVVLATSTSQETTASILPRSLKEERPKKTVGCRLGTAC